MGNKVAAAVVHGNVTKTTLSVLSVTLVYCGQTLRWIRKPLGTDVGLGPGDIMVDGDPALPAPKWAQHPPFLLMSIVAKRLDGARCTWYGGRTGSGDIVLDCFRWRPSSPSLKKGAQQPQLFGTCLLWPNGRPSQQLLSSCCKTVTN